MIRLQKALVLLLKGDIRVLLNKVNLIISNKRKIYKKKIKYFKNIPLEDSQPLVSVVIPCFNYGKYVVDAVDSILSQTLYNLEIIVVDGGSDEIETIRILRQTQRPRTKIIFRDGRHLVGDNRNYGISIAKGRYICCLDADDTVDPTYLEKAVFYLETYGYDMVSTGINFVGTKSGCVDVMEYPNLRNMVDANHVTTCAVFRRNLWELVGGYVDFGLGKYHVAEDWDFWVKISAHGARIRNIHKEHLFNYRIHERGSLSSSPDVMPITEQKKIINDVNRLLLNNKAFRNSENNQSIRLKCNPTNTALASSFKETQQRRTLLIAMPYFLVGGAERLLSGICQYLSKCGWRILIISTLEQSIDEKSSVDWFKEFASEVYSLPNFLNANERVDFVHYLIASRSVNCILNTGSHFLYELTPELNRYYYGLCIIDFLFNTIGHVKSHMKYRKFISHVLAENEEVYNWIINDAGWAVSDVSKVCSGVDLDVYRPHQRPDMLVNKYTIEKNDIVVGFSGRFSSEKAPDVFLEVAALCRKYKNLRFIMTGGGPLAKSIVEQANKLPEGTRLEIVGIVDDVSEYLALYDLLVLPSKIDGRPLIVMEALACGVPVIASNIGGLPELVRHGENGYIVPVANSEAIAAHLIDMVDNPVLLRSLKASARSSALANLDANSAYRNFEISLINAISKISIH